MTGAAGQVGNDVSASAQFVFINILLIDGATPEPGYAIYHKLGMPDSSNPYQLMSVITPATDGITAQFLMDQTEAAGFDNDRLDATLTDMVPNEAGSTLGEKLIALFQGTGPGGYDETVIETVARAYPQTAVVLGQAYVAQVPKSDVSSFEIRRYNPNTSTEGSVIGRVTTGVEPAILPAPDGLSERVEPTARGHLRVLLRWCIPDPLRVRALHWSGFKLFRIDNQAWSSTFGDSPPLDLDRGGLLAAIEAGDAVQVNRNPVTPGFELSCPTPASDETYFISDDNDTLQQFAFETGGLPFEDGDEFTYYVAAADHFGRIGEPSPGLSVLICDRLRPLPPSDVRVENVYDSDGSLAQQLEISWAREPSNEVLRYHVLCYPFHDSVSDDLNTIPNWPDSPARIAIVDNTGDSDRLSVVHTGAAAPSLPADDGKTFWYVVIAEDNSSCKDSNGFGNLSGPGGAVPGSLYDMTGPGSPEGRLRSPCCKLNVSIGKSTAPSSASGTVLVSTRNASHIRWAEYRASDNLTGDTRLLGRHYFSDADEDMQDLSIVVESQLNIIYEARFGTDAGLESDWVPQNSPTDSPNPDLHWIATWSCNPSSSTCVDGIVDPVDPVTGDLTPTCIDIIPTDDAVEFALFRKLGNAGPLVMLQRRKFDTNDQGEPTVTEACEPAPPGYPTNVCYFVQQFDRNGNPSVMSEMGCITTLGVEGFPTPNVTQFTPFNLFLPEGVNSDVAVSWFSPTEGVERFELAITPIPPFAANDFSEMSIVGGLWKEVKWGTFDSPRIPAGFGSGGPDFTMLFALQRGINYTVKVRAKLTNGLGGEIVGPWSNQKSLRWTLDPGELGTGPCPVNWPARAVPSLQTEISDELYAERVAWHEVFLDEGMDHYTEEVWIEVGSIPAALVLNPSAEGTSGVAPPIIETENLEAFFTVPMPFSVYLHQTSAQSRGTMLQASHYVKEVLVKSVSGQSGQIELIDRSFAIKLRANETNGDYALFFRVKQPLFQGRNYRCAVVLHGMDAEPISVRRTLEVSIPVQ